MNKKYKIAIIGLGYVGLPLARLFATKYAVVGFDINHQRVSELNEGHDSTREIEDDVLMPVIVKQNPLEYDALKGLYCSSDSVDIKNADIYIITVPTPIDRHNRPDLNPLYNASETVGKVLKKGDIVIYESTVYPGVTEEECIPVLEKFSGLKFNEDFFAGYSPERINPGDKEHTVEKIRKVTSGSTPEIGQVVDNLYKSVITAGTHLAPTIKVAEASKVIENSQRDVNIAFMNELAKIFSLMDIDTHDVLEAAGTKWNFLPFKPGLVGGHCIGVDPFYLAQKAQEIGYYSELILSARRLNDSMGSFVASQVIKLMIDKEIQVKGANILNLGITFKENCPDIRNSKAIDIVNNLKEYGSEITVYDPWANPFEVKKEYEIISHQDFSAIKKQYDVIILTVSHHEFLTLDLKALLKNNGIVYDVKGVLTKENVHKRL
ncbi:MULTISPECIES: nucleotide sugar dehydrogenase [Chryseobacterium]|uniref:UDP-N-acetyl-D-galactosamine dehydrogenase n=1 Tax=Chryseobacterium camelliae TaxID=1265445 RepID=A0ABU0TDH8_9FLAO|nr:MULTISPECIES: nucleotide sugar dehydrogenase [Chryseobacterium]MDT3407099.1 UDP-N-acetyl-D-galactosamine dehydrogenase [Pseudacidovorax intermedius]MDQ1095109.1 UDP-N-acetyl-D-galactosamine dehydrogenase [Chryseobacterium camelliae]MDQ1099047.1 UDP-N-acetyl-D-galactosamine dehydrogenase [Chryseobacterium sp. SORGH_AS_1048]MDR6086396.1 UDP-N-acetyl-D-galactosamine dehydrogenase [Chryseobacterium sp. SORGH_AS_0909]MDR6130768.1 UDP-N-acetyl-D-galactosamine dehydrogenase [Chryseobacterium sp. S